MLKSLFWIVVITLSGFAALCGFLYLRQRSMLYYPTPPVNSSEARAIRLTHEGQNLKVWHVERETNRALIYFGGNAEDVALNISLFKQLFPRHALFLPNYRGYGGSSGEPSQDALFSDAAALYDHVQKDFQHIAVMGRSLGSGVAVYLASERPVERLVLVTPYDSMVHVASLYYPFIPVSLLLKDRYESIDRAALLDMPVLALVAEQDEVIPGRSTDELISALPPGQTIVKVIAGATHNSIGSFPEYQAALSTFLNGPVKQ